MPVRENGHEDFWPNCSDSNMLNRLILLALALSIAVAAKAQLSGTVKNELGKPLEGASVALGAGFRGTITLNDGSFRIDKIRSGETRLRISYVGYQPYDTTLVEGEKIHLDVTLLPASLESEEVIVAAGRAGHKDPVAWSEADASVIESFNQVQDIPYLLSGMPSVVISSDGGSGVGYSSLRIRGTDPSRINVMINGIPYNDSESHDVYWVNIPDMAGSADNIQVQRGVGTSTHGTSAFGANINIRSSAYHPEPYVRLHTAAGSFNTLKASVAAGTGLINDHFLLNFRSSRIHTDGYIDRAFADLGSTYLSGGWFGSRAILKFTFFTGKELTYQAWGGVPSDLLEENRTYNPYTYDNEVDDYQQHHLQLHGSWQCLPSLTLSAALHYTRGKGFYEQFREQQRLTDYLMQPLTLGDTLITRTDLVRQKWLDNHFGGLVFNAAYQQGIFSFNAGGGWNLYDGDHFGRVIWARFFQGDEVPHPYYFSNGTKEEWNVYAKTNVQLLPKVSLFADIQFRMIDYEILGLDDDQRDISQHHLYPFFNPRAGFTWDIRENQRTYLSLAVAHREPKRSNYTDAAPGQEVSPERLYDLEAGYQLKQMKWSAGLNFYHMQYIDQLILTGEINDVGAPVMVNVPESYRRGIEGELAWRPSPLFRLGINATLSKNKVIDFTEYVDDWDTWEQRSQYLGKTDLAFSPSILAGATATFTPWSFLYLTWTSRYVGKQYIDNSASDERMLNPYWVNHLNLSVNFGTRFIREVRLFAEVINLFDARYETNAWVYSYFHEGNRLQMNGYFPQAGRHYLIGLVLSI